MNKAYCTFIVETKDYKIKPLHRIVFKFTWLQLFLFKFKLKPLILYFHIGVDCFEDIERIQKELNNFYYLLSTHIQIL